MRITRRDVLLGLVPRDRGQIIDVGADHGEVAATLGAVATERQPHRAQRPGVPWVVADGIAPFRSVPVAVIAGMGARTILAILDAGPRPEVLVAHAQDEPDALRIGLAARGWRIDAEALAPEARGYAAVLRALPGTEPASGMALAFGPRLIERGDPFLVRHVAHQRERWERVARETEGRAATAHAQARSWLEFLEAL